MVSAKGLTQIIINTQNVDLKSYELFQQNQWKELIKLGTESKKKGIDFYYLQYRMGIAYYNLKNYRKAIPFFKQITEQSPEDKTALEYLFYAYTFAGFTTDARNLSRNFSKDLKDKLNIFVGEYLFDALGFEYKGYSFPDYTASADVTNQSISKTLNYYNFNLTHYSKNSFTLFHSVNYLQGTNQIYNPDFDNNEFDETLKQLQYYISGNWHYKNGYDMKLAFHYILTTREAINPGTSMQGGQGQGNNSYYYNSKINGVAGLAKLSKSVSNFNIKVATAVSNLNSGLQVLPSVGFDYFPFGNTNIYTQTDVSYQYAPKAANYKPGFIFKQKIGVRIINTLWIEPFVLYGTVSNLVDEDAYLIYNKPDVINYWYGANINLNLFKNKLILYYISQNYSSTNFYRINEIEGNIRYNTGTNLLGVKWNL